MTTHSTISGKTARVQFNVPLRTPDKNPKTSSKDGDGEDLLFEDGVCVTPFSPSRQFSHLLRNHRSTNNCSAKENIKSNLNLIQYKQAMQRINALKLSDPAEIIAPKVQRLPLSMKQVSVQEQSFICWINEELNTLEKYRIIQGMNLSDDETEDSLSKKLARQKLHDQWETLKTAFSHHIVFPLKELYEKLLEDIHSKKYVIKKELSFEFDVGMKDFIVKLFLENYEELWLILVLDTLLLNSPVSLMHFGTTSNSTTATRLKIALKNYLGLVEKATSTSYGSTSVSLNTASYTRLTIDAWPFVTTFAKQLDFNQRMLGKSFFLILLLDAAKECVLIPENPLLFQVKSSFKSSKVILEAFGKKALLSEGDLVKRLGYNGFKVVVKQEIFEEFEGVCIRNLSSDLRNGIHLARLLQTLTLDTYLLEMMIIPQAGPIPSNERVKIATMNMKTVFKYLEVDKGMDMSFRGTLIKAEDIVNGHREKTLSLLWKFVIAWKIPSLISRDQLLEEIDCLTLEIKEKELYWNVEILSRMPTEIRFVEDQSTSTITSTCNAARGGHLELLFEWIWCVVALQSDLYISDFSYDFMDGRVFCSLLSYYYPALLHPDFQEGLSPEGLNNQVDLEVASNHRVGLNPMKLFIDKMQEGFKGLPPLITEQELIMDEPDGFLDEKIIITLCAHLSRILLAHKDEIRACKVIQRFIRRFVNE